MSTWVCFYEPVPIEKAWDAAKGLLGAGPDYQWEGDQPWKWDDPRIRRRSALPEQGLHAWLGLIWCADGPLGPVFLPEEDAGGGALPTPPQDRLCLIVDYGTTYRFRIGDAHCEDLHAWLARELPLELSVNPETVWWYAGEVDEWHPCTDEGVRKLGNPDLYAPHDPRRR